MINYLLGPYRGQQIAATRARVHISLKCDKKAAKAITCRIVTLSSKYPNLNPGRNSSSVVHRLSGYSNTFPSPTIRQTQYYCDRQRAKEMAGLNFFIAPTTDAQSIQHQLSRARWRCHLLLIMLARSRKNVKSRIMAANAPKLLLQRDQV